MKTNLFSDSHITLNVRVKERENSGTRKGPIGSIFKDTPTAAIRGFFRRESSHDLKDSIKRPLSGLIHQLILFFFMKVGNLFFCVLSQERDTYK